MTHREPGSVGRPKSSYRIAWSCDELVHLASRTTVVGWLAAAAPFRLPRLLASVGVPYTSWRSAATSGAGSRRRRRRVGAVHVEGRWNPAEFPMTRANTCPGSESAMQLTAATRGSAWRAARASPPPPWPSPQHRIIFSACDTVTCRSPGGDTYTDPLRRF